MSRGVERERERAGQERGKERGNETVSRRDSRGGVVYETIDEFTTRRAPFWAALVAQGRGASEAGASITRYKIREKKTKKKTKQPSEKGVFGKCCAGRAGSRVLLPVLPVSRGVCGSKRNSLTFRIPHRPRLVPCPSCHLLARRASRPLPLLSLGARTHPRASPVSFL